MPPASYLVDTNVLLRLTRPEDVHHQAAVSAVDALAAQGSDIHITAQNIVECWNVMTRPAQKKWLRAVSRPS